MYSEKKIVDEGKEEGKYIKKMNDKWAFCNLQ